MTGVYRIQLWNRYSIGGLVRIAARDESGNVLTFANKDEALAVWREFDHEREWGQVYEVKRGAVNADATSSIDADIWRKHEGQS